jgi:hypothetical protein
VVGAVAGALASAEARHVAEDLGVVGGEAVRGRDHLRRPRRRVALEWDRRQRRVFARSQFGGRRGARHRGRISVGRLSRRRRGLVIPAGKEERAHPDDGYDDRAGNQWVESLGCLGRLCRRCRSLIPVSLLTHDRTLYRVCQVSRSGRALPRGVVVETLVLREPFSVRVAVACAVVLAGTAIVRSTGTKVSAPATQRAGPRPASRGRGRSQ